MAAWEFAVCFSVNAPANLIRLLASSFWFHFVEPNCPFSRFEVCVYLSLPFEIGFFLAAVFFVWYEIGVVIEQWTQAGLDRNSKVHRIIIDLVFVLGGGVCAFVFIENVRRFRAVLYPMPSLGIASYAIWPLALLTLFGQDLARVCARKS